MHMAAVTVMARHTDKSVHRTFNKSNMEKQFFKSDSVQQELKEVSEETVSYIKGLIYGSDDRTNSLAADRYEKVCLIGEGSYGRVYKCRDKHTGAIVAIKKFLDSEDDSLMRKMALREIRMLKSLKHANLVNLVEVFKRRRRLHLVLEFCEYTVLSQIESHAKGVTLPKTMSIIWQTLRALDYCHSHNCIHRDVKPENILLTRDGVVKLCDFGFARTFGGSEAMTDYVATRWYRAPELLVGHTHYDTKVDVWATGCVFAELVNGDALWPGRSDLDQLFLIRRSLGDLLQEHMDIFSKNNFYFGLKIPEPAHVEPIDNKLSAKVVGPEGVDFLKHCVDKDPSQRWTCEQLMDHDFFRTRSFKIPILGDSRKSSLLPSVRHSALSHESRNVSNISNLSNGAKLEVKKAKAPRKMSNHHLPAI